MGSSKIKGITIEIAGNTTALEKSLSGVNKKSKDLQGELKSVERLLKLDPTNTTLLAQKQKILAESVGNTKEKLDKLKDAEKQVQAQFKKGEVSEDQYRALQREIIQAEQNLKGVENQAKQSNEALGRIGEKAGAIGSTLTNKVTKPMIAAIGVITAGLSAIAISAGDAADELMTTSTQLSISTDTLQEWRYAARFIDTEVEDMSKGLAKVTKAMGEATKSNEDYIELANGMKISIRGSNGELLDSEDVFYNAVDAIGKLTNETDKEITSQELFGKSYQDMMPLIQAGSESLKKYGDEAKKLGIVMSEDDVKALGKFDDSMETLQATTDALKNKVAIALIPAMEDLIPIIRDDLVPAAVEFAEDVGALIEKFLELDEPTQKLIIALGGIVIAAGPVLSGASSLLQLKAQLDMVKIAAGMTSTTGAAGSMTTFGTSILSMLGPITVVVAALGSLLYLTYELSKQDPMNNPYMWNGTADQYMSTAKNLNPSSVKKPSLYMGDFKALASGGIVTKPTVALIGEGGESEAVIPLSKLNQGTVIHITGNYIANDYDVDRIAERITNKLAREQRRNK